MSLPPPLVACYMASKKPYWPAKKWYNSSNLHPWLADWPCSAMTEHYLLLQTKQKLAHTSASTREYSGSKAKMVTFWDEIMDYSSHAWHFTTMCHTPRPQPTARWPDAFRRKLMSVPWTSKSNTMPEQQVARWKCSSKSHSTSKSVWLDSKKNLSSLSFNHNDMIAKLRLHGWVGVARVANRAWCQLESSVLKRTSLDASNQYRYSISNTK